MSGKSLAMDLHILSPLSLFSLSFPLSSANLQILGITLAIRSNPIISIWSSFSKGNWLHCFCTQVCPGGRGACRSGLDFSNGTSSFAAVFLPGAPCIWHYTKSPDLKLGFELESSGEPLHTQMFGPCFTAIKSACGAGSRHRQLPWGMLYVTMHSFLHSHGLFSYTASIASSWHLESERQRNIITAGISYRSGLSSHTQEDCRWGPGVISVSFGDDCMLLSISPVLDQGQMHLHAH